MCPHEFDEDTEDNLETTRLPRGTEQGKRGEIERKLDEKRGTKKENEVVTRGKEGKKGEKRGTRGKIEKRGEKRGKGEEKERKSGKKRKQEGN